MDDLGPRSVCGVGRDRGRAPGTGVESYGRDGSDPELAPTLTTNRLWVKETTEPDRQTGDSPGTWGGFEERETRGSDGVRRLGTDPLPGTSPTHP